MNDPTSDPTSDDERGSAPDSAPGSEPDSEPAGTPGSEPAGTPDHAPARESVGEPNTPSPPPAPAPEPVPEFVAAPRPSPGPRHSAVADTTARHPRRWFLAGAGAAVVAGAGGVGAALLRTRSTPKANPPPAPLLAAVTAERTLIADLDATTGGTAEVRRGLVQARADHAAHLRALQQLAAAYDAPAESTSPSGVARTAAQLRAVETKAAADAATRAAALDGRAATLLASIAACEAGHAELLS